MVFFVDSNAAHLLNSLFESTYPLKFTVVCEISTILTGLLSEDIILLFDPVDNRSSTELIIGRYWIYTVYLDYNSWCVVNQSAVTALVETGHYFHIPVGVQSPGARNGRNRAHMVLDDVFAVMSRRSDVWFPHSVQWSGSRAWTRYKGSIIIEQCIRALYAYSKGCEIHFSVSLMLWHKGT